MKNQYFGDINDYLKYGILRCFSAADLRVAVCWMLTPNDGRTDGRKTTYLSKPDRWRPNDPLLFDSLLRALRTHARCVRHIEDFGLLANTSFFHDKVPEDSLARESWLEKFIRSGAEADLLFFDPDNGIEVDSTRWGTKGSSKYIFWHEIRLAWSRSSALLIFQHFCRERRDNFIARLSKRLKETLPDSYVRSIVTAHVVYFLVYRQEQSAKIECGLGKVSERWHNAARIC